MKKLLLFTISFCFFLCGCNQASVETISSNTVQSSQIYQTYFIEADKSQTSVVATFRVGGATGTTLELSDPGKILYNSAAMQISAPSNLIGTNYRTKGTDYRVYSKLYNPAHEFLFTDNDGKTFVNSINLAPFEVSTKDKSSLENSQPTTIMLSRVVGKDEKLTIAIDSIIDDDVPTSDNSVYLNESRNSVVITPKYWQTKSLKAKAELIFKIKRSGNILQGTPLGGSISIVYSAAPISVSVGKTRNPTSEANTSNTNAPTNKSKPFLN